MKFKIIISVFFFNSMLLTNRISASGKLFHASAFQMINADSILLENAFVRVMKNATVKKAADAENFGKRIIVPLSELIYNGRDHLKTLQRGEIVVFSPGESDKIVKGDYFEIAVKKDHPDPKGPEVWLEPLKNNVVYEDDLFRVFEERLAPGDTRQLHSHSQRVVVRLNNVQLTDPRINPGGVPGQGIQVPNTVRFAEPIVHVVKNLSTDTPLFNIIMEFKTPVYNNRKN